MTARFEYRVRPDAPPNARCFDLVGVLDSSKAMEALAGELRLETAQHLLMDFSRVTYINSTGFGTMLVLINELMDAGKKVYITDPHARVRVVFEQLGGEELPIFRAQDALNMIKAAPPPPPLPPATPPAPAGPKP